LDLSDKNTYLFELIFRNNRIVVDYGKTEDLFLITIVETETGVESAYEDLKQWASKNSFPIVKRYDGINDIREITQKRYTLP